MGKGPIQFSLRPEYQGRAVALLAGDILLITVAIHFLPLLSELLAASYFIPIVASAYWWEVAGASAATAASLVLYALVSVIDGGDTNFIIQQMIIKGLLFYFAGFTTSLIAKERRQLLVRLRRDEIQTIGALATAMDAKDHYTHDHSEHVMRYAIAIGKALGMNDEELELLEYQAMLHDVGNIGVPDALLNKSEVLTREEIDMLRYHVSVGVDILKRVDTEGKLAPGVAEHHERYDGKGYPKGLSGEGISLNGRILSVADSFAAMSSDRPYRKALSRDQALEQLRINAGSQFDPQVVEAFLAFLAQE